MAIHAISLDEAEEVKDNIEKIFKILDKNEYARKDIETGGEYYNHLKKILLPMDDVYKNKQFHTA